MAERDAWVRACEARAGAALRAMTETEGLSLREAVGWCGGQDMLPIREAARLRKVVPDDAEDTALADTAQAVTGAGETGPGERTTEATDAAPVTRESAGGDTAPAVPDRQEARVTIGR